MYFFDHGGEPHSLFSIYYWIIILFDDHTSFVDQTEANLNLQHGDQKHTTNFSKPLQYGLHGPLRKKQNTSIIESSFYQKN